MRRSTAMIAVLGTWASIVCSIMAATDLQAPKSPAGLAWLSHRAASDATPIWIVADDGSPDFPEVHNSASEDALSPMPAAEAARKMRLPDGFRATVVAAEPEVRNPIAMAWDAQGRLWIAENYTYSDAKQHFDLSLRDRVLIFEDRDNDGRADVRKVFIDRVQMLTSVEVGHGGVWLMCPPRLLFVPDADGDDIPDGPPQVVLDGFTVAQANYHNFANGLRWGPDGWLYGRCGHSCPGQLGPPGTPANERVPIDGGIWRYHPKRRVVEVLCHGTVNPWGHDWDANGELFFINTVIGHLWHAIPGAHFKESFGESANPDVYERLDTIADHYHFDNQRSWTASRDGEANDLGGGHAHIGAAIYQGQHWPRRFHGRLLTLNMHGRRTNVDRLERTATGYVGRHEQDVFLAADPFFRAVDLSFGPDDNLYIIDWSDTGECHEHSGVHRRSGRIFKISYGQSRPPQTVFKPACLGGKGKLPRLWKAYQAGTLSSDQLRALEHDPEEHVRVWAIRLLTDAWPLDWLTGPNPNAHYPDDPATRAMLLRMARMDPSGLVQTVLASTLQRLPVEYRAALATELVRRPEFAHDHNLSLLTWYGLIGVVRHSPRDLVDVAAHCRWPHLMRLIAHSLAERIREKPEPINELLELGHDLDAELQQFIVLGMRDAYRGWRKAPRPEAWRPFIQSAALKDVSDAVREINVVFGDGRAIAEVRQIALDPQADIMSRQNALQALIRVQPDDLKELCLKLLDVRTLNRTALQGLAQIENEDVAKALIAKYRKFHPEDRPAVIETLVSRQKFAQILLQTMAKGKGAISPSDITASHARQILSLDDPSLRKLLAETWGELRESPAEKSARIAQLMRALTQESLQAANLANGHRLFQKTCSSCHVLFGEGHRVGPDLTGAQRANLEYLLRNVVDPSAVVPKDYRMTVLELRDGRVLNGLVVAENDRTLELQTATERVTVAQSDIQRRKLSSRSAMPDGLLQNFKLTEVRDLIAYLQSPVPLLSE